MIWEKYVSQDRSEARYLICTTDQKAISNKLDLYVCNFVLFDYWQKYDELHPICKFNQWYTNRANYAVCSLVNLVHKGTLVI